MSDGRILTTGVITAEAQRREIGAPREEGVPLTPAQAARLARDEYPGDDVPPGYERHTATVRSDREAAERRRIGGDPAPPTAEDTMRGVAKEVERIRAFARADAERAKARVSAAIQSGTSEERECAADDARETVKFVRRVKEKIGL